MRKGKGVVLALAVMLLGFMAPSLDAAGRDVLLGTRWVNFQVDHDEIVVGAYRGNFRRIRFNVLKNDVEIFDLILVYANGERDKIPVKLIFNEQERSRIIDLEGRKRKLQRIIFNYRSIGPLLEGKAEIKVFGIR
jgi:flavin-dependent dehydrogenase